MYKVVLTSHAEALIEQVRFERELVAASVGTHEVVGSYVVPVAKQASCFFLKKDPKT